MGREPLLTPYSFLIYGFLQTPTLGGNTKYVLPMHLSKIRYEIRHQLSEKDKIPALN